MVLSTKIDLPSLDILDFNTPIVCIGSCFAKNVEKMLGAMGFNILKNGWGTHYNTFSISRTIKRMVRKDLLSENEIWKDENGYTTLFYSHSQRYNTSYALLKRIHEMERLCQKNLYNGEILIMTLGLTEIYIDNNRDFITTNLNGLKLQNLEARFLTFQENIDLIEEVYKDLKSINPKYKIILTVSPVALQQTYRNQHRLISNSASKATLRAVANEICEKFDDIIYFPAYDIVFEELKSWDSFLPDTFHVTLETTALIMSRFIEGFFDNKDGIDLDLLLEILKTYVVINDHLEAKDFSQKTLILSDHFLERLHDIGIIEKIVERPVYGYALASYYKASFLKKNNHFKDSKNLFNELLKYIMSYPSDSIKNYRDLLGGIYFHKAEMEYLENDKAKSRNLFEQCLTYIPDHVSAVKYLKDLLTSL
jgi:hypothetical protein